MARATPARQYPGVSCAAAAALCALALSACASAPTRDNGMARDPLEPFNRSVYAFNDALDKAVIKPAAKGYEAVVPGPVRGMVGNFFGNLRDVWTAANQVLQGKPREAFSDISRVAVNSTFGFFGIADVASEMGLEKHEEDFGQTLGVWGVPAGPYLVLPFFGPSSIRDGIARVPDFYADPLLALNSDGLRNNLWLTRVLDTRVRLFPAERLLQGAALDQYSFTRDAWVQRRRNQIYDGNPPPSDDDYDSNPLPTYDEEGTDDSLQK